MTYGVILTIMNVLSFTVCCPYKELDLINKLNNFFNFDHNVFILDSAVNINHFINMCATRQREYVPKTFYIFNLSDDTIMELESLKEINSKNTFLIVALQSSDFESYLQLLTRIKEIQLLNVNMKIGFFFSNIAGSVDIEKLFQWSWEHRILNIFAAFYSNLDGIQRSNSDNVLNILNYNPFETFNVINVTGDETFDNLFFNKFPNLRQHPFQMGIYDGDHRFEYSEDNGNIRGGDAEMWRAIFGILNASMAVVVTEIDELYNQRFGNSTFDIFPQCDSITPGRLVNMYPIETDRVIFMVPEASPYSEFTGYLRTITSDSFFSYSIMTIVAIMCLLSILRYSKQKKILFFQCVADVLNLLMNDNGAIKYQQLSRKEILLILPLTFAGFVMSTGLLSILQSYVTRPVLQPQIETIDDILRSPYSVLIGYENWTDEMMNAFESLSKYGDWSNKLRVINATEVRKQISIFNKTFVFPYTEYYGKVLLEQQKRYSTRAYRIPSQIYLVTTLSTYNIVNDDFPFIESFNEIMHWVTTAGLYEKWKEESYVQYMKNNFFPKNRSHYLEVSEKTAETFPLPLFLVYGWIAGALVLVIEIIWKHLKKEVY